MKVAALNLSISVEMKLPSFGRKNHLRTFPGGPVVKILPANARDAGSVPRSGRPPGGGNGNSPHCCCLGQATIPWAIPWTEESGGLQSMRSPRVRHDLETKQKQQCYDN